jgi:hypothetical protein
MTNLVIASPMFGLGGRPMPAGQPLCAREERRVRLGLGCRESQQSVPQLLGPLRRARLGHAPGKPADQLADSPCPGTPVQRCIDGIGERGGDRRPSDRLDVVDVRQDLGQVSSLGSERIGHQRSAELG